MLPGPQLNSARRMMFEVASAQRLILLGRLAEPFRKVGLATIISARRKQLSWYKVVLRGSSGVP